MTFLRIAIPLYPFDLSMIFSGKPVSTFPDHALAAAEDIFVQLRNPYSTAESLFNRRNLLA